jgi:hypothetical protein
MPAGQLDRSSRHESLESWVPGNLHAQFGGGPTEKAWTSRTSPAAYPTLRGARGTTGHGRDDVAPPGNQADNGEHELQPTVGRPPPTHPDGPVLSRSVRGARTRANPVPQLMCDVRLPD